LPSLPNEMQSLFLWGQSAELLVPAPARDAEFFDYHSRSCFGRQYKVIRVVDGDTIVIRYSGKYENVRMVCVNTPESVHPDEKQNIPMGKVAARYVQKKLLDEYGEYVDLEFEIKKLRGNYGRLLAYVFVDGKNLNLDLVRQGLSPYYTKYGKSEKYDSEFHAAKKQAWKEKLNIGEILSLLRNI